MWFGDCGCKRYNIELCTKPLQLDDGESCLVTNVLVCNQYISFCSIK